VYEALAAMFGAMRRYATEHSGRYSATVGAEFQGQQRPPQAVRLRTNVKALAPRVP